MTIGVCAVIEEKIGSASDIRGTGSVDGLDEPSRRVAGRGRALRIGIKGSPCDRDVERPLERAGDASTDRVPIVGSCLACAWACTGNRDECPTLKILDDGVRFGEIDREEAVEGIIRPIVAARP